MYVCTICTCIHAHIVPLAVSETGHDTTRHDTTRRTSAQRCPARPVVQTVCMYAAYLHTHGCMRAEVAIDFAAVEYSRVQ